MTIGAGIGIANFTFDDGNGFWEWIDLCDNGGVDSIWQSERIIEKTPNLEIGRPRPTDFSRCLTNILDFQI